MKILVTGGCGFIGSKLVHRLSELGHGVRVLDSMSSQIHRSINLREEIITKIQSYGELIIGDVSDIDVLRRSMRDIDTIVHLAAETGTGQSMYEITKYIETNIKGTSNIAHLLVNENHCVKKIVVASSRAIYGEGKYYCKQHGVIYPESRDPKKLAISDFEMYCSICSAKVDFMDTDEKSMYSPTSIYGITKLNQEQVLLTTGKALGITTFAMRYQNVYGPGQSLSNPYTGILSIFSTRIRNNKDIQIFEDGKGTRDFVFIDDVVDATVLAIESSKNLYIPLNVGSGQSIEILEVSEVLRKLLGKDVPININGHMRYGDIRHNRASLVLIQDVLKYKPKTSFPVGVGKFVDWVLQQDIEEDKFEKTILELKSKGLYK